MIKIIAEALPEKAGDVVPLLSDLTSKNPSLKSLIAHYMGTEMMKTSIKTDATNFKQVKQEKLMLLAQELLITQAELNRLHDLFLDHYNSGIVPANFNDVNLHWSELSADINEATNPIATAYNFIHRFTNSSWSLTAQRVELTTYGDIGTVTPVKDDKSFFNINHSGYRFESDLYACDPQGNWYDPAYMTEVTSLDNYPEDRRVKSIILPAQELHQLIRHNLRPGHNERDYDLNFKCVSYEMEFPNTADTWFPHCVAVYASNSDGPCLDNGSVVAGAIFRGKAGNFDGLCPPNCKKYLWPLELSA